MPTVIYGASTAGVRERGRRMARLGARPSTSGDTTIRHGDGTRSIRAIVHSGNTWPGNALNDREGERYCPARHILVRHERPHHTTSVNQSWWPVSLSHFSMFPVKHRSATEEHLWQLAPTDSAYRRPSPRSPGSHPPLRRDRNVCETDGPRPRVRLASAAPLQPIEPTPAGQANYISAPHRVAGRLGGPRRLPGPCHPLNNIRPCDVVSSYGGGHSGLQTTTTKRSRRFEYPRADSSRPHKSGSPGVRESGSPGVRESGSPGVRESGSPGVRESGSPDRPAPCFEQMDVSRETSMAAAGECARRGSGSGLV